MASRRGGVVATIGVFDGVHRGHRALLEAVRDRARELDTQALVVGFDPYPISVLAPAAPPSRLSSRRQQIRYFCELGLEQGWLLRFTRELASLSPEQFLDALLAEVPLAELWIGHDFRFGKDRAGGFDFLVAAGERHGFVCRRFDAVRDSDRILSSTWVRTCLRAGEIERAEQALGHSFAIEGDVVRGRGEGAKLLVPTANVELSPEQCLPLSGVYAVRAELDGRLLPAVANLGVRPTMTADPRPTLEVHLLDFAGDLYGRPLPVHFVTRLRDERRFPSPEALRAAIAEDVSSAREILRKL